jgi:hypothetical protein
VRGRRADAIAWSEDLLVVDARAGLGAALAAIRSATVPWIVIRRPKGPALYAFRMEELLGWPPLVAALQSRSVNLRAPLDSVLGLSDAQRSTSVSRRTSPPAIHRGGRGGAVAPSTDRYVEVGTDELPKAVGAMAGPGSASGMTTGQVDSAMPHAPPSLSPVKAAVGTTRSAPPPASRGAASASRGAAPAPRDADRAEPPASAGSSSNEVVALEDEGTTPIRHPSIETDRAWVPGAAVRLTIDLLRQAVAHTQGGVDLGVQAADWSSLELTVNLQCAALAIDGAGTAMVTIRRNAASKPGVVAARVRADAAAGPTAVMATFFQGTRYCGSAVRILQVGAGDAIATQPAAAVGTVAVEPDAEPPDLTVHISALDPARPGCLRWLVVTGRFDGLPPKLEATIDLGREPAAEATALFKAFAVLERGQHQQRIEGFGSRLWALAPPMFRAVYWALADRHAGRPLTIQFISDEPHLPWELMRPVRDDESEIHAPLALRHAVARWIKRWDGYMRNSLPPGRLVTIAPKYASASRVLKRAQTESEKLVTDFAAQRTDGTRAAVLKLLENATPAEPVSILHFAGHGQFAPDAAIDSNIKLEDGALAASEIERPEVRLGRACRTLVFFNACEVGAAGAVFGEVGGWADAFLGRQFGGFIAPLWSVDDEDAGVVATELLERIGKRHEPIGAALREIRAAHGATSPTFYSYLYYGDVTARFAVR